MITHTYVYIYIHIHISKQRISLADLFPRNPRSESSIESLFMRRGRKGGRRERERKKKKSRNTHTRDPRDLTVRSLRGSSSPIHGDDNDSQGGPPRATSFVPVVQVSARHHRRIYILLLLLFSSSTSVSFRSSPRGSSKMQKMIEASLLTTRSVFYRSKRGPRTGREHTREPESSWKRGWCVLEQRTDERTRRERRPFAGSG